MKSCYFDISFLFIGSCLISSTLSLVVFNHAMPNIHVFKPKCLVVMYCYCNLLLVSKFNSVSGHV